MSLKDIDLGAALHRLADRKIEQAIKDGKFDRLEGAGKPLDLEPMPAEENARLTWWALRLLKQNDFIPHEVQWLKQIEQLKEKLEQTTDDTQVVHLVAAINRLVFQLNTLGTNAISGPVAQVSLEAERAKRRTP
ncbi:DnaJ family domain-containing protein [Humisphaera borealis]|uniref:DUF1992 domain-containing protein n=1 Tax=Humisphaera borealis TaxID=2807512 RepID=A0A7M2WTK0_9BACT|nr:DUF1992 domain-containing protein [Humisphaera borealis]QOV88773.1 DUF1992 domain-containing protein [Humisphaera borealis]